MQPLFIQKTTKLATNLIKPNIFLPQAPTHMSTGNQPPEKEIILGIPYLSPTLDKEKASNDSSSNPEPTTVNREDTEKNKKDNKKENIEKNKKNEENKKNEKKNDNKKND